MINRRDNQIVILGCTTTGICDPPRPARCNGATVGVSRPTSYPIYPTRHQLRIVVVLLHFGPGMNWTRPPSGFSPFPIEVFLLRKIYYIYYKCTMKATRLTDHQHHLLTLKYTQSYDKVLCCDQEQNTWTHPSAWALREGVKKVFYWLSFKYRAQFFW